MLETRLPFVSAPRDRLGHQLTLPCLAGVQRKKDQDKGLPGAQGRIEENPAADRCEHIDGVVVVKQFRTLC